MLANGADITVGGDNQEDGCIKNASGRGSDLERWEDRSR